MNWAFIMSLAPLQEQDMDYSEPLEIHRPGGMIINQKEKIPDQPPTICDPDHLISIVADKRLLVTATRQCT